MKTRSSLALVRQQTMMLFCASTVPTMDRPSKKEIAILHDQGKDMFSPPVWVGTVIGHELTGALPWQGPCCTSMGHVWSPYEKGLSLHSGLVSFFSFCLLLPCGHGYSQGFQSASLSFFRAEHFRSKEMKINRSYFKSF